VLRSLTIAAVNIVYPATIESYGSSGSFIRRSLPFGQLSLWSFDAGSHGLVPDSVRNVASHLRLLLTRFAPLLPFDHTDSGHSDLRCA
jgi:hypothetical protein